MPADKSATRVIPGLKFDGSDDFDYFRPASLRFASILAMGAATPGGASATAAMVPWDARIPLPPGVRMHRRPRDNMPLLSMSDIRSVRFRRVYGYIGAIKFINDEHQDEISFDSPAMIAIIVKLWWRSGSTRAEGNHIWAFFRIFRFLLFRILAPFRIGF